MSFLEALKANFAELLEPLGSWGRKPPVATPDELREFVASRAGYVAQVTLYGYLKARVGTRYVSLIEDPEFAASMTIARDHIYAACLGDLAVYAVAQASGDEGDSERLALAQWCVEQTLATSPIETLDADAHERVMREFRQRLEFTNWAEVSAETTFTRSADALVEWSPVAPELKSNDTEIVENSIRFKWIGVRKELAERLDAEAVLPHWREGQQEAEVQE
ncbi:MAG: hypothetical protein VX610_07030 [SAR324 cluster bacterium]|nr:hypothetical protein [SAR324 cluster bacterium]